MELQTAIEILKYHQEWRLGKRNDMIHEPKKLTEALDIVLSKVKEINKLIANYNHKILSNNMSLCSYGTSELRLKTENTMMEQFILDLKSLK